MIRSHLKLFTLVVTVIALPFLGISSHNVVNLVHIRRGVSNGCGAISHTFKACNNIHTRRKGELEVNKSRVLEKSQKVSKL